MAKTQTNTTNISTTEDVNGAVSVENFNEINPTEDTVLDVDASVAAAKAAHDDYIKQGFKYNPALGCYSIGGL